jgi:hypothetical protein
LATIDTVDIDGTRLRLVTDDGHNDYGPVWKPR